MKLLCLQFRRRYVRTIAQLGETLPVRFPVAYKGDLVHRIAVILLLAIFAGPAAASEGTQVVDAKIAEVTERGFILQVGGDHLTVEDSSGTKFWHGKAPAKRDAFHASELVTARIRTNLNPPELRELADRASWSWLDRCRKQSQSGTIEKVDDKFVVLKLSDGSSFAYRATEKSKVVLTGRPGAKVADLEVGQRVYVKGRTLATLDTWLAEVSDVPAPSKPVKAKAPARKTKPAVLPSQGQLTGMVLSHQPKYRMFDIVHEFLTLHISYTERTKFYLEGKLVKAESIQQQQKVVLTYSRDKFGRINASKVELSNP